jgi:hypothetical protein
VGPEHPSAVIVKSDPAEKAALRADLRLFVPKRRTIWLAVDLEDSEIGWDEVQELLEGSDRQVTLQRMRASLAESNDPE